MGPGLPPDPPFVAEPPPGPLLVAVPFVVPLFPVGEECDMSNKRIARSSVQKRCLNSAAPCANTFSIVFAGSFRGTYGRRI